MPGSELGVANGLGQSLASLSRTLGPTIGGALWGPSVRLHLLALNFLLGSAILVAALNINMQLVCLDKEVYSPGRRKTDEQAEGADGGGDHLGH